MADWFDGGAGTNTVAGEEGADLLFSMKGASDVLNGGPDRDCLAGKDGDGLDAMFGGDGRDRYGRDPGDTISGVEVNVGFCIGE